MMPWQSAAQRAWGHSPEGMAALGGPDKVKEWDQATGDVNLPQRKGKKRKVRSTADANLYR